MTDITTPVGRLVQGSMKMQQRKDITSKQPVWKDEAKTIPDMGCFFSLAYPKLLPTGQPNAEFAAFYGLLQQVAATAWPQFFPQGAGGACSNPNFSMKVVDGDGKDTNGQPLSGKPGFKGHWIVKFDTSYPVKVFNDGHFAPHEELQNPDNIVKRGYWLRVVCEAKSNNADLTKRQVPGIAIYPKLVSFIGGRREDEIVSGPDAQEAFGKATPGWRPDGISQVPGAPVGGAGVSLPTPPSLAVPTQPVAVPQPTYVVAPHLAQQGHTLATIGASMSMEQAVAAGYVTVQQPVAPTPSLHVPGVALPTPGGLPGLPVPGAGGVQLPTPGLAVPGVPLAGPPSLMPPAPLAAPQPTYVLKPEYVAAGATIEGLIAQGWTMDALVQAGHVTRIG